MIFLFLWSCTPSATTIDSTNTTEDSQNTEETPILEEETCPLFVDEYHIIFETTPAMSLAQEISISVSASCNQEHVLLQSPTEWIDDPHFTVEVPSSALIQEEASLSLVFTPSWEQEHFAHLNIPYTHLESPLSLTIEASVSAPLPLLFVGGQLRRVLTLDYGQSITQDTQEIGTQRNICWGNNSFLIVGGSGGGAIWRSQNALNWQEYTLDTEDVYACAYGNNRFIMYASGLYHSIAGVEWEEGQDTPWMEDTIRDIAFAEGIFVAVGDQGRIATTINGTHWNRDALQGNFQLNSVVYGNGRFVAVGNFGAVLWSEDKGDSWTTERVGESTFSKVVFGNGYFFISDGSDLYRSHDGMTWTTINTDGVKPLAAYGTLLIGNKGQSIYHSTDLGETWSLQSTLSTGAPLTHAIIGENP